MVEVTTPQARVERLKTAIDHLERALRHGDGLPANTRRDLRDRLLDAKAELHRLGGKS